MKKHNTRSKSNHLNLNSNTTLPQKSITSGNNIWIKSKPLTTKTPNWRKSSTLKIWKLNKLWLRISKLRTTMKIQSNSWRNKTKTWKTRSLKQKESLRLNSLTSETSLKASKNPNFLSLRMPIIINWTYWTDKLENFNRSSKIETMNLILLPKKSSKLGKVFRLKSSEPKQNLTPKSMKIESRLSSFRKILTFVILTWKTRMSRWRPLSRIFKAKLIHSETKMSNLLSSLIVRLNHLKRKEKITILPKRLLRLRPKPFRKDSPLLRMS